MNPVLIAILFFIIGGVIISVIATSAEIKKHRPVKTATDAQQYIVPGEAEMTVLQDNFLRTNIQRRRIVQNNQQGGPPRGMSGGSFSPGGRSGR